ncbi:MAG TPA: nicotinate phosphoribosyltransferase [Rubrobacteraceae bacterium]|nr:nicotinate phosphoribosyltransferase [Rubrobacteraceae bacterium]
MTIIRGDKPLERVLDLQTDNGDTGSRFNTASYEEIKGAEVADVYFHRTMEVLRARGAENTPVHVEVTLKSSDPDEWFVVAGLDEVAHLLDGVEVEARAVREGTICRPHDPVLTLTGPYASFAEHETAILGFLCQASGIATGAARCRIAAGERPVISFGARRMHPSVTPMIERSAYLGGCDSVAVELAARRIGIPATGTLPHALALVLGSTHEAARAFDEVISKDVNRTILIDTFDDEKFGALIAAKAIPDSIFGVRLDTPGNRRGNFRELMEEVRWELDRAGFPHVKIFASGGIGVDDILDLNPVCDAYGVGGSIAAAPMVDYSLDIVEVNGTPRAKRGKRSGRKRLIELQDGSHAVIPAENELPAGSQDLLLPLEEQPQDVSTLREEVLSQLATGRFSL